MAKTAILVVDDSVTIRAMMEVLLERDTSLEVVGVARDADEAFALIAETDPDVITLDIAMPGTDGMQILRKIMSTQPRPVIMLSSLMREGSELRETATAIGAAGCFNKNHILRDADTLIAMIKDVAFRRGHRPV
ncbi:response regulator [Sphingobium subterraneum]|uniref:Two-component system chemotaxis response regulator CheB n=1 Tax=Sphingobium subterraneum TaxID=627688 RepID=A0A841J2Q4_9SPHN|nr:response regulator [Sphingobium subterraneum]MBB6125014.1 two-component system chemotaxis response regulator CheB [Sphingobium subterraneum]